MLIRAARIARLNNPALKRVSYPAVKSNALFPLAASRPSDYCSPTPILRLRTCTSSSSTMADTRVGHGKGNPAFLRNNLFDLTGKIALVTGGGSGLGLMTTQTLAANGARVYITGRTASKLDTVVSTYGGEKVDGEIIALTADVSSKEGIKKLYDDFASREDHLHLLVNNAGISSAHVDSEVDGSDKARHGDEKAEAQVAQALRKAWFDADASNFEDWRSSYNTNAAGVFFVSAAFLPLLQRASSASPRYSASILNISSISGLIKASQRHFAYNASKAAAVHLTRMLAAEVSTTNGLRIRVNGIAPGVFPSEMTTGGESDEAQKSKLPKDKLDEKGVPAGRPGKDEDFAGAVLFAASNQYLNGETVVVDGGYTLAEGM